MKFIHVADIHFGADMKSTYSNISLVKERRQDLFTAFKKMISYANQNMIDLIVIAGDMFDKKKISVEVKNFFMEQITKNSNITFLYVSGNHDNNNFINELDNVPKNLKLYDDNLKYYDINNVRFYGTNETEENINALLTKTSFDSFMTNVIILHGEYTTHGEPNKIQTRLLTGRGINYVALGHIHKSEVKELDENTTLVYPGCLEGIGFDEDGIKGFYVVDTNDFKNPTFIPNSVKVIRKIEAKFDAISDFSSIVDKVIELTDKFGKNDIVEVYLTGSYEPSMVKRMEELENYMSHKFFHHKIKDNMKLYVNPMKYANDNSIKGVFINKVLNSDLSEEEKSRVLDLGIKVILGGEF